MSAQGSMCMESGDANEWMAIYFLASRAIANGGRFDRRRRDLALKRILHGRSQPPPHGDGIRKQVKLNSQFNRSSEPVGVVGLAKSPESVAQSLALRRDIVAVLDEEPAGTNDLRLLALWRVRRPDPGDARRDKGDG